MIWPWDDLLARSIAAAISAMVEFDRDVSSADMLLLLPITVTLGGAGSLGKMAIVALVSGSASGSASGLVKAPPLTCCLAIAGGAVDLTTAIIGLPSFMTASASSHSASIDFQICAFCIIGLSNHSLVYSGSS